MNGCKTVFDLRLRTILMFILLHCACVVFVQAQCSGDNVSDDQKYRVRLVKVDALFGRVPKELTAILAKHRNELFRTTGDSFVVSSGGSGGESSLDAYQREVRSFFESNNTFKKDTSFGVNQQKGLYIRATFATTCVEIVPPADCEKAVTDQAGQPASRCVDVTIKIRVIPVDTANPAANLLDLARSNQLRFYRELPRPLLALNPTVGFEQDKSYGPSIVGKISTEFIGLPALLSDEPANAQNTELRLSLNGRKSLKLPFYDVDGNLSLSHIRPLKLFEKVSGAMSFVADRHPKGDGILKRSSLGVGARVLMSGSGIIDRVSVGADYQRVRSRFTGQMGLTERTSEDAFSSSAIADGKLGGGFVRGALWFDSSSPDGASDSYRRAAASFAYAGNIVLPQNRCRVVRQDNIDSCVFPEKNAPVIGVEMIFGIGKTWGDVPGHARFYGGNTTGNFLYDAIDASSVTRFPEGPLMRSFGRNRAGAQTTALTGIQGGNSYQHFNLSVSLPVGAWSRPLIPAIAIVDQGDGTSPLTCSQCSSLKDVLKNQVDKGKNIYIAAIASQSLTDQQREDLALEPTTPEEQARLDRAEQVYEAARVRIIPEADALWSKLTPTVGFIADRANLYSVKPLLMFDAARISANGASGRTRFGFGGGLQFNIVIAKFEAGYMRTIRRVPGDDKGNFVVRMVFERLF